LALCALSTFQLLLGALREVGELDRAVLDLAPGDQVGGAGGPDGADDEAERDREGIFQGLLEDGASLTA
jgi:hypothetical protein